MHIEVSTDRNINGQQELITQVTATVQGALGRFSDHLTRIEVHINDVNGEKEGTNDMRCMIEARMNHRQPIAVTEQAGTVDQAVEGAASKMTRLLDSTIGKLRAQQRQPNASAAGPDYAQE